MLQIYSYEAFVLGNSESVLLPHMYNCSLLL